MMDLQLRVDLHKENERSDVVFTIMFVVRLTTTEFIRGGNFQTDAIRPQMVGQTAAMFSLIFTLKFSSDNVFMQ